MDIGSAKPTAEERARARHWLIDEIDPRTPFNAADYQKLALEYIKDIDARGKVPIVCGGTGLYVNSLIYDMDFSAPEGDDDYRQKVYEEEGGDAQRIHERLKKLDPRAAEDIHVNNVKRALRAIERLENGEEKLARFAEATQPSRILEPVMYGLDMDRKKLYERINTRVDKLFEAGLAEEVLRLMDMGFTAKDVAMKGIGYKEIIEAVQAGLPPESASEIIKTNTRHYARRQLIWFRRYPQIKWIKV